MQPHDPNYKPKTTIIPANPGIHCDGQLVVAWVIEDGRISRPIFAPDAVEIRATAQPAAQQSLSVPDEKPLPDLMMASYHEAIGWNAYRKALLAALAASQPLERGADE